MRLIAFAVAAAMAAFLTTASFEGPAFAQSGDQPAPPGLGVAPTAPSQTPSTDSGMKIEWEVKNRFRLFRQEADFRKHVAAYGAGSLLAAEHQLEQGTKGRGWAQAEVDRLCVNAAGGLLDTCERDGEREDYVAPKSHSVVVRLIGAVPPGANCNWSFDDGTVPARQLSVACAQTVTLRVAYGKPTIAAAGVTRADGTVDSVSAEVVVKDILIAGLGDSVAAGEGNPDKPIALSDDGFCFRRFLGAGRSEYFRPSREGYKGDKACEDSPAGSPTTAADWNSHGARWMSAACHRSLYSYQLRAALALAIENKQAAVTFLPLACSGATIENGLFRSQGATDCPLRGSCTGTVPPQLERLQDILARAQQTMPARKLDMIFLTVGANDVKFSGLVADVIMSPGVERTIFNQSGQLATPAQSQVLLERELPANFAKLRSALKPLVGGNLGRVVYVSYGHPAMVGGQPCPGGRDGLDIHPAFTADATRLRNVTDFVLSSFLPKLKAMARCETGVRCGNPDTDSMTFVDAHQAQFENHGICARADADPEFDRQCFSTEGTSFESDPVQGATGPLTCSLRAGDFRPYAPRARWIRTANDSYFTAMSFPRGLPATMQPSNIHDATWGAMSAVYGGAFHPSAEGQAAMADAALPAARAVLGFKTPSDVTAQPLPPPSAEGSPQ